MSGKIQTLANNLKALQTADKSANFVYCEESYLSHIYPHFVLPNNAIRVCDRPNFSLLFNDTKLIYDTALKLYLKQNKNVSEHTKIVHAVTETVCQLLGGTNRSENKERYLNYAQAGGVCPMTRFYGKDVSECSERALAAHNLFKFFGMISYFVAGPITINNTVSAHHYNIIKLDNDYVIYDLAACPTSMKDGKLTKQPLVKTLSEKELQVLLLNDAQKTVDLNAEIKPTTFNTASGKTYHVTYGQAILNRTHIKSV